MKLTDEEKISEWAYYQCKNGNDTEQMRNLITYDYWIYYYCKDIKDIKEMWTKIKSQYWICHYCLNIKNREELTSKIFNQSFKDLINNKRRIK